MEKGADSLTFPASRALADIDFQLLFGEKNISVKEDGEEIFLDVIFHSILYLREDSSFWEQSLKQSTNLIIPFLPYNEFNLVISKFYLINKIRFWITIVAALHKKSIQFIKLNEIEKAIEGGLVFFELEPAIFEGAEVGKEIGTSREYGRYYVADIKIFCENFFKESEKALEYFLSIKQRIDREYCH